MTSSKNDDLQNIVLVANKNKKNLSFLSEKEDFQKVLSNKINVDFKVKDKILTDDFAPVEYNLSKTYLE